MKDWDKALSLYVDGELSLRERAEVERALDEHADLRAKYENLRTIRASLRNLPDHDMPFGLHEKMLKAGSQKKRRLPKIGKVAISFGGAAAAALVIALAFLLGDVTRLNYAAPETGMPMAAAGGAPEVFEAFPDTLFDDELLWYTEWRFYLPEAEAPYAIENFAEITISAPPNMAFDSMDFAAASPAADTDAAFARRDDSFLRAEVRAELDYRIYSGRGILRVRNFDEGMRMIETLPLIIYGIECVDETQIGVSAWVEGARNARLVEDALDMTFYWVDYPEIFHIHIILLIIE